jgi:hypothetical protein
MICCLPTSYASPTLAEATASCRLHFSPPVSAPSPQLSSSPNLCLSLSLSLRSQPLFPIPKLESSTSFSRGSPQSHPRPLNRGALIYHISCTVKKILAPSGHSRMQGLSRSWHFEFQTHGPKAPKGSRSQWTTRLSQDGYPYYSKTESTRQGDVGTAPGHVHRIVMRYS